MLVVFSETYLSSTKVDSFSKLKYYISCNWAIFLGLRYMLWIPDHRHLSNKVCLMARTTCLVCFISTVNGRNKKIKKNKKLVAAHNKP